MLIANPKELCPGEFRMAISSVAMTEYVQFDFDIIIEKGAGTSFKAFG